MTLPAIPPDETQRLAALREYGILDSAAEESFDDLVKLASEICGTPVATITLIDANRQWYKSRVGLPFQETSRDVAFCAHTILGEDMLEVPDMREDERFADNPAVAGGPEARFYAGTLLRSEQGFKLGTLCVIDLQPRVLTPVQRQTLRTLGAQVERLLELRLRVRDLERAQRAKAELVAYIVHDLKSPLMGVMFSAETVAEEKLSDDGRSAIEDITLAAAQLDRMVTNLLAIGRAEDGVLNLSAAPMDLPSLLAEVAAASASAAARTGAVLDATLAEVPLVRGDRSVLRRVLSNLIDNALKYGAKTVRFAVSATESNLELRVIDDGPGVPAAEREKVFERRVRLDRDVGTDDARSQGLGLAFCRMAIDAHGGAIWVEESQPRGATFAVRLPRAVE